MAVSRRARQRALAQPRRTWIPRPAPGFGQQGQGGYQGIDRVLEMLTKGVNQQQYGRMQEGRTGGHGWGAIGGMGGAFQGLSPYAVNWLAQNALEQRAPQGLQALTRDVTGEDGTVTQEALTGADLTRAQLMNNLITQNAQANPVYGLKEGIDEDFLGQIFGIGFGGQSAYEKGYNAEGRLARPPRPFMPRRMGRRFGRGGRLIRR